MQHLQGNGIKWRNRRLINKMYMDQCVKIRWDQREIRCVKAGRGVRQ